MWKTVVPVLSTWAEEIRCARRHVGVAQPHSLLETRMHRPTGLLGAATQARRPDTHRHQ